MFAIAMQYFNSGMRSMIGLALLDLFAFRYKVGPAQAGLWLSYINLPWALKLLYGIFSDSLPIFGSTKRYYILLMGIIQFLALSAVAAYNWPTAGSVVILSIIYSFGGAFEEVVCQGMMVVEARRSLQYGSGDFQTWGWIWFGLGGFIGSSVCGVLTTLWPYGVGARLVFAFAAIFPLILAISGPIIDKSLEAN